MGRIVAKPKQSLAVMVRLQNGEIEVYSRWRERIAKKGETFKAAFLRVIGKD